MGGRMIVHHEFANQGSILRIIRNFGRHHSINVLWMSTVHGICDENVNMWKATLLKFDGVDETELDTRIRKHGFKCFASFCFKTGTTTIGISVKFCPGRSWD
jgi:hypothetical protein